MLLPGRLVIGFGSSMLEQGMVGAGTVEAARTLGATRTVAVESVCTVGAVRTRCSAAT